MRYVTLHNKNYTATNKINKMATTRKRKQEILTPTLQVRMRTEISSNYKQRIHVMGVGYGFQVFNNSDS